jgi:ABC-2 type transport system ATP-binding protein
MLGHTLIVQEVDVHAKRGEFIGILGTSGGGKTILLQSINGQITPLAGGGTILGFDLVTQPRQVQIHTGYVPQDDQINLYQELTPLDNIELFATMYDKKFFWSKEAKKEIHHILDLLDIAPELRNTQVKYLSGGEKKRVSIAIGISHNPQVLFLDEPTTGLDERLKNDIFNYLKRINKKGTTIVMVSHNLVTCEYLDHIIILKKGKVVASGKPRDLLQTLPGNGIAIEVILEYQSDLAERIANLPLVEYYRYVGRNTYKFFCRDMPEQFRYFVTSLWDVGLDPIRIVMDDANLLDYFLIKV